MRGVSWQGIGLVLKNVWNLFIDHGPVKRGRLGQKITPTATIFEILEVLGRKNTIRQRSYYQVIYAKLFDKIDSNDATSSGISVFISIKSREYYE